MSRAPLFAFRFSGVFLLFGLAFFSIGLALFYVDWRFAREAQPAQGIVLTKETSVSRDRDSSSGTTTTTKHYQVTYRFTVEGTSLEGRDELSFEEWQRLAEGGPVAVRYRPRKPSSNQLAGHSSWLLKTVFALLGFVFTVLGSTLFVRAARNDRLERRLRQNGVSAQATVTGLGARNLRVNDVQLWRLNYEYLDFQGQRQLNTIDLPEDEAQQWKVGDIGSVLYDSTRPAEAVWLGRP